MRPIPPKLKKQMSEDPFYKRCCVTGLTHRKIDWHHNLIYAGRQVNERWCILPLVDTTHAKANEKGIKFILDWIMLNRATDEELEKYSKAKNLKHMKQVCNDLLGVWQEGTYPTFTQILAAKRFTK